MKSKKTKSKKMNLNKKGGASFIDDNFIKSYETNLEKIKTAIANYSNKHAIDKTLANEFIEQQTSAIRREAAQNLIDNTIYITLEEVFDIVGKLIDLVYSKINNENMNEPIYLYSGEPKKSFYFLSVIALFHIKTKNYKEPIFVKKLDEELFETTGNHSPIIILDDVSYSGAQLSNMLSGIYINQTYKKKKDPPNIYVALVALNDNSKYSLTHVPVSTARFALLKESPFKLIYLEDRLYKPIVSIIGIEKYIYMTLLFSPWTLANGQPYVSIYLDHKIADAGSTYTTTLLYGPIPSAIDFHTFLSNLSLPSTVIQVNEQVEKTRLFNELDDKYKKGSRILSNEIIANFMANDVPDKEINGIVFKPFISNCNQNSKLIENINNMEFQNLDYLLFMIPESCINNENDNCVLKSSMPDIQTYLQEKQYMEYMENKREFELTETGLKILSIHKQIEDYKCPISWYKKGDLAMTSISTSVGGSKHTYKLKYKNTHKYKHNKHNNKHKTKRMFKH